MAKYKEFYEMMVKQNTKLFEEFQKAHDGFMKNPEKWKTKFNQIGSEVLDVVRDYENRLCRQSEGAGNSKFTTALSEKFQAEVKSHFPKINHVGID